MDGVQENSGSESLFSHSLIRGIDAKISRFGLSDRKPKGFFARADTASLADHIFAMTDAIIRANPLCRGKLVESSSKSPPPISKNANAISRVH
jgi:hypothetical protein